MLRVGAGSGGVQPRKSSPVGMSSAGRGDEEGKKKTLRAAPSPPRKDGKKKPLPMTHLPPKKRRKVMPRSHRVYRPCSFCG